METDSWTRLASTLNIDIVAPFIFETGGKRVVFAALFPQFGTDCGMVVDPDWENVKPHADALLAAGYCYSCVQPGNPQEDPPFDMLRDWGWTSLATKPEWY